MKGAEMSSLHRRSFTLIVMLAITCALSVSAQDPEKLSEDQKRDFLLNAKVVNFSEIGKGVTRPFRLVLSDGRMVHDASFQSIDEYAPLKKFDNGTKEVNFRDSYKYNLAAFEIAKLVGLGDMLPVTVERKWNGKMGAVSWWLPYKLDEKKREQQHIDPPNPEAFSKQMYKIIVFRQLVYDSDRNSQNILISEDWNIWRIDFTRAFRLYTTLENPKDLVRCDRTLLQKLRQLDAVEIKKKTKNWLGNTEIKGVMARRDKIVALFEDLIAKQGENKVLYD
jgi:hypothetical protein